VVLLVLLLLLVVVIKGVAGQVYPLLDYTFEGIPLTVRLRVTVANKCSYVTPLVCAVVEACSACAQSSTVLGASTHRSLLQCCSSYAVACL
jgi:hypothetical protein